MKINPINEMSASYREIRPVETKDLEINVQKTGVPSPVQEAQKKADEKKLIDDGRETIGISNDGDTARASREGLENINEGIVLKKTAENIPLSAVQTGKEQSGNPSDIRTGDEQNRIESDEAGKAAKNVGSLLSYSQNELERLYLQGEINSNQLDKELERREEVRGEKTEAYQKVIEDEMDEKKTNDKVASDMEEDREYGVQQVTSRDRNVNKADHEASDRRVETEKQNRQADRTKDADNKEETEAAEENRKRIITEEMALDDDFEREMGVLSGAERQDKIVSDALDTAVENGRLKVMEQILGVDPATASMV